jgi:hypothetical protein
VERRGAGMSHGVFDLHRRLRKIENRLKFTLIARAVSLSYAAVEHNAFGID